MFIFMHGIGWDLIQIEARWEQGQQQNCSEEGLYEKLGLKNEDEKVRKEKKLVIEKPLLFCGMNIVMCCNVRIDCQIWVHLVIGQIQ
jgi:hypothetical protein